MKLAIFVDRFPARSQTFVINQVVGLLALGVNVTVLSLSSKSNKSERDLQAIHPELVKRTLYLLNENNTSRMEKFFSRVIVVIKALFNDKKRQRVIKSMASRFGHHGKSLLLAKIASQYERPLQFDMILCHFGYNGIVANKLRDIGVINGQLATIFHGFDISAKSALIKYKTDYQQLFLQTELMLPISELWQKKLLELGCAKEKIKIHRMGVDLKLFEYQPTQPNEGTEQKVKTKLLTLFTVARFSKKKGLEYAIRSLALLDDDIDFHYYLGGFGELEEELKQLVIELRLEDSVTFLGSLNQQQVKEYMITADAFIQPSITAENGDMEGIPVAIMEAMAMGTPVISTFHSGIPEIITHGEHGLLAQECDAKELAENIARLYRDENFAAELSENARQQIGKMSDVDKLNRALVVLLTDVVSLKTEK
ncbi:MAG: colanic acid/amylovoran biosynthesis glycosyltransferase [Alteromonadaceae bacterium]|jgi:colanic acid/amylovoran biosynthesis glycosyltransferase